MLTPREKSPLPENFPRGGSNPQRCGQRAQTLPMSYSGPPSGCFKSWRPRVRSSSPIQSYTLTYLCPSLPVEHRPSTTPPPPNRTLFWAALVIVDKLVPLLFRLCFSVSPPTVARPAFLSLPLRVPGQGLACGAGCWLPEGVCDPAPLPLQYLLGHWFLSHLLPQIFISGLLLPLDFVDAPQTGVIYTVEGIFPLELTWVQTPFPQKLFRMRV